MSAERLPNPTQADIDCLFPAAVADPDDPVQLEDLPYITRPIVEYLHERRPAAAIAADRDGRLVAYGVWQGWKRHYPGEPFPTEDHKIHFARVTSRSARYRSVEQVVHFTLARAGVERGWAHAHKGQPEAEPPNILFIDDWPVEGGVIGRFVNAAERYGLPARAITYATMCGEAIASLRHPVEGVTHVRGDPGRNPLQSVWMDESKFAGVSFGTEFERVPYVAVTPEAYTAPEVRGCREWINVCMDRYYARYRAALTAGSVAGSAGLEVAEL